MSEILKLKQRVELLENIARYWVSVQIRDITQDEFLESTGITFSLFTGLFPHYWRPEWKRYCDNTLPKNKKKIKNQLPQPNQRT